MNDLSEAVDRLRDEINRAEREYQELWANLAKELKKKKQSESGLASKDERIGGTEPNKSENESSNSVEGELESYLDDVIKRAAELRVEHCKIDFENDLEDLSETHDLTLLANETLVAAEERKKHEIKRRKAERLSARNESATPPLSVRERGKAYKPPPLPKAKTYQTTYRSSFRPVRSKNPANKNSGRPGNSKSDASENSKQLIYQSKNFEDKPESDSGKGTSVKTGDRAADYVSSPAVGVENDSLSTRRSLEDVLKSNSTENVSNGSVACGQSSSVSVKPKTTASYASNVPDQWPPMLSRHNSRRQIFEEFESLDPSLSVFSARLKRCSKSYVSSCLPEIEAAMRNFEAHLSEIKCSSFQSFDQLLDIDSELDSLEVEILKSLNTEKQLDFTTKEAVGNRLRFLKAHLEHLEKYSMGRNFTAELDIRKCIEEKRLLEQVREVKLNGNIAAWLLDNETDKAMKDLQNCFDIVVKQIDLAVQKEVSNILDKILANNEKISTAFVSENVELLKNLYSLVYNDGSVLPNFVINDL